MPSLPWADGLDCRTNSGGAVFLLGLLRVIRRACQTSLTAKPGCWHAHPPGVCAVAHPCAGCSPWRLQSAHDGPPTHITHGSGGDRDTARLNRRYARLLTRSDQWRRRAVTGRSAWSCSLIGHGIGGLPTRGRRWTSAPRRTSTRRAAPTRDGGPPRRAPPSGRRGSRRG